MFTYICLGTNNLARAARFYDATMAALGLARCDTSGEPQWDDWVGWGTYQDHGAKEVALWLCKPFNGGPAAAANRNLLHSSGESNTNLHDRATSVP